jgi:hypothetical protein
MENLVFDHLDHGKDIINVNRKIKSMNNINYSAILLVLFVIFFRIDPNYGNDCNYSNYQSLPDLKAQANYAARIFYVSPSSTTAGGTIHMSPFDVLNIGNQSCGTFSIGLYISTDNQITIDDLKLKSQSVDGLQAGSRITINLGDIILPNNLSEGTYYVGVIVDDANNIVESNENNNVLQTYNNLNIFGPVNADLQFADMHIGFYPIPLFGIGCPFDLGKEGEIFSVAPRCTLTFFYDVKNAGDEDAPSFKVSYYLSTDQTITSNDLYLGSIQIDGLSAGNYIFETQNIKLPNSVTPGDYFIGVVLDSDNQVDEVYGQNPEGNNIVTRQIRVLNVTPDDTPIWRVQLRLKTADVDDAGTDANVIVGIGCKSTYLDYTRNDFEKGCNDWYDLLIGQNFTYGDLSSLSIMKDADDDWCLSEIELVVNGASLFTHSFPGGKWIDNSHNEVEFGYSDLRLNNPDWNNKLTPYEIYQKFDPIKKEDISSMIQCTVGNNADSTGNYYWRDGSNISITKNSDNSVKVYLPLEVPVAILPDPNVDVDFILTFNCTCNGIQVAVSDIDIDVSIYGDVLLWINNALARLGITSKITIGGMINGSMMAQNINPDLGFCPDIYVDQNANINLNFFPTPHPNASLDLNLPSEVKPGSSLQLKFTVNNLGNSTISGYTVQSALEDSEGNVLLSYPPSSGQTLDPCFNTSTEWSQNVTIPSELICNAGYMITSPISSKDTGEVTLVRYLYSPDYFVESTLSCYGDEDLSNNTIKKRLNVSLPDIDIKASLNPGPLNDATKMKIIYQISNIGLFPSAPLKLGVSSFNLSSPTEHGKIIWLMDLASIPPGKIFRGSRIFDRKLLDPLNLTSNRLRLFVKESDDRKECNYSNNEVILIIR